jgi:rubrerythrin
MPIYKTRNQVEEELKIFEFELMGDYTFCSEKIIIKDKYGYAYKVRLKYLKVNKPRKFYFNNPFSIQNIKLWLKLNNKKIEILSERYVKLKEKLNWKCLNCNEYFDMDLDCVVFGNQSCPYCSNQRVSYKNSIALLMPLLMLDWDFIKNNKLDPNKLCTGSKRKVWWICSKCGHNWETIIKYRCNGRGCPNCNKSRGENKIKNFLMFNNIKFIWQKTFKNCRRINILKFDFYLIDFNCCIEYDGQYHYEKNYLIKDDNKSLKVLSEIKERDEIKTKYCKNNNIKLLRIPYWDFDNIEKILYNNFVQNKINYECGTYFLQ